MNSSHTLQPVFTAFGIARVQGNAKGTAPGGSTSITATLDYTPTEGNVLIAVVGAGSTGAYAQEVTSISQTGVTWTKQVADDNNHNIASEIWLGVVGSGASETLTVNLYTNIVPGSMGIVDVCEYTGIATTNYLDKTASQNGGPSDVHYTGTTNTTTQADELWIGGIFVSSNYDQTSPSNGFTLLDGAANYPYGSNLGYFEKIVSSTGTAVTSSHTFNDAYYYGCIATFKAVP
jgi:hypothetical protein